MVSTKVRSSCVDCLFRHVVGHSSSSCYKCSLEESFAGCLFISTQGSLNIHICE